MAILSRLDSLDIEGFRGFSRLRLNTLGDVNLLVGRNNVGKTSLLEALAMYASGEHAFKQVRDLLRGRDEYAREAGKLNLDRIFHSVNGSIVKQFRIGPVNQESATLMFQHAGIRHVTAEDGRSRTREIVDPLEEPSPFDTSIEPALVVKIGDNVQRAVGYLGPEGIDRIWYESLKRQVSDQFLPAMGFPGTETNDLWDQIVLTDREDDIVTSLQLIDKSISRISTIEHPKTSDGKRIVLLKRDGSSSPEPLKSLGDGMNRLFELALMLVNCADSFFLVDEIENGLHYSVQPEMWKFVIAIAKKLNIQVFATTHSWDCIEAFQEAVADTEASCQLIRLQRYEEEIIAEIFDRNDLRIITRDQIEIR